MQADILRDDILRDHWSDLFKILFFLTCLLGTASGKAAAPPSPQCLHSMVNFPNLEKTMN